MMRNLTVFFCVLGTVLGCGETTDDTLEGGVDGTAVTNMGGSRAEVGGQSDTMMETATMTAVQTPTEMTIETSTAADNEMGSDITTAVEMETGSHTTTVTEIGTGSDTTTATEIGTGSDTTTAVEIGTGSDTTTVTEIGTVLDGTTATHLDTTTTTEMDMVTEMETAATTGADTTLATAVGTAASTNDDTETDTAMLAEAGEFCHPVEDDSEGSGEIETPVVDDQEPAKFATTLQSCSLSAHEVAACAGALHSATVSIENGKRVIRGNAIPNHGADYFPNAGNPNSISAQTKRYEVTLSPTKGPVKTALKTPGVAINGIKLEPETAERYSNSAWSYEALMFQGRLSGDTAAVGPQMTLTNLGIDCNFAHVQPTGEYHYHGVPTGLLPEQPAITLVGWAADGFPILGRFGYETPNDPTSSIIELTGSYRVKSGPRQPLSSGDSTPPGDYDGTFVQDWEYEDGYGHLDECNGRVENITIGGEAFTYVYYMTHTYPFLQRCVWGTPDATFGGGGNSGAMRPRRTAGSSMGMRRSNAAVDACIQRAVDESCSFVGLDNLRRSGLCQDLPDARVCTL